MAGVEVQHSSITDIKRSLYNWPKSQAHTHGTKKLFQALHSIGVPSFLLSNMAIRGMYGIFPEELAATSRGDGGAKTGGTKGGATSGRRKEGARDEYSV